MSINRLTFVLCYDEDSMHETIERASHEQFTEEEILSSVCEYIAGHKFFARDPRNGQVEQTDSISPIVRTVLVLLVTGRPEVSWALLCTT